LDFDLETSEENQVLRMKKKGPSSSQDQDAILMKMHGKVKSLEGRYLDLAKFYKRELLAQGGSMHNSRVSALWSAGASASASREKLNQNKSKDDFGTTSAPPES